MASNILDRLAVCSWSLQPATPQALIADLNAIGIPRAQIALDPIRAGENGWGDAPQLFADAGISCVSGMMVTIGEDYTSMESIRRTGGVVPDQTWEGNWANFQINSDVAASMGLKLVTIHAGFLPEDESDPDFARLMDRVTEIADLFSDKGIDLAFETGQETAETLVAFLQQLGRPKVGVNFDPANMILYQKGDPIDSLKTLAPFLKQCHLKDARGTEVSGAWGDEVVVGTGEVDWKAFFAVLEERNDAGYLCFEREFGAQRVADIKAGAQFVRELTDSA